jgi:carbonic anhydrase
MEEIERFIAGFRVFQKDYFGPGAAHFEPLKAGQNPRTMIVGCSDSRVDPAILTNAGPGDIFMVRNVANLVPPYEDNGGRHGVSAALEFAVCHLEVEHLIVLGHSQCGGIHALMNPAGGAPAPAPDEPGAHFIDGWMSIAAPARQRTLAELPHKPAHLQQRAAEQAAILLSLENLHTFPFIDRRVQAGKLSIHGWYFDLQQGELLAYDPRQSRFRKLAPADS